MDGPISASIGRVIPDRQRQTGAHAIANACLELARLAFAGTVILAPFRMRDLLVARPMLPVYHDYTDLLLFASDLFLLATLTFWVLGRLLQPRRFSAGPRFLSLPLFGIVVVSALSTLSSVDPVISGYRVVRLMLVTVFYAYVVNEVTLAQLGLPVAAQIALQSVVGIAQALQQHSLGLGGLQELVLDPAWSGVSVIVTDGVRSLRAYGLTDHPNILGGCLAFGLLLLGTWYVRPAALRAWWQPLVTAVFLMGALGLALTFSRSAWLAFASGLGLALVLLAITRQREPLAHWFSLGAAAALLLVPFLWHSLPYLGVRLNANDAFAQVALEERSLSERDYLLKGNLQLWSEHALFGVGIGASPQAEWLRFPDPNEFGADYQPVHIVLLEVATEIGIFGGLVWLIVMLTPWLALFWNRKRLTWSPALIGLSGVLLAVTVVGLFDYYTWLLAPGQLWQWLIWGAWSGLYAESFNTVRPATGALDG